MLKRIVQVSLVSVLLSLFMPITSTAQADDTYERICLTLGWTSCGEWTIYDSDGVQKNRVVGPTPLSALIALGCQNSGINLCGDNSKVPLGYAVQTGTFSPPNAAELAARVAAAEAARLAALEAEKVLAAKVDTPTASPNTPSTTTTTAPSGLGGYAVVAPDGRVCGVIVATSSDPFNNGGKMSNSYMGCPAGSPIVFQTFPSADGNVAGWHGQDVFYFNGVFYVGDQKGSGLTIRNGVVTQSVITRVVETTTATSDTKTVTVDTRTVTTDTRTVTTDTRTVNVISDTSTSISTKETVTVSSVQDTQTINAVVASLSAKEKEEQLQVALRNNRPALINVSTEFAGAPLKITATRQGYKSITINLRTDLDGNAQLNSSRNLRGFTVVLSIGKVKLDTDLVRK
jgi:hypothetical protein